MRRASSRRTIAYEKRYCIFAVVSLLLVASFAVSCFAAAPAIDASGASKALFNNTTSGSVSITTTSANDLVLLFLTGTRRTTPSAAISTIATTGLTWAKRTNRQDTWTTNCFAAQTCFGDVEIWWACSTSALSAASTTVTMDRTTDEVSMIAFGVTGVCPTAVPWDTNVGLPVSNANATGSNTNVQLNVTTSGNSDLIFIVAGTGNNVFTNIDETCSGWQQYNETDSSGPTDYALTKVAAKGFVSAQTGLTISTFASSCLIETTHPWTAIADAVTNSAASSSGGSRSLMGVGQ